MNNKFNLIKKIGIGLIALFLVFPIVTFSQVTGGGGGNTSIPVRIANPFNCGGNTTNCSLMTLINSILNNIVMPIAAVAVVMWIVWAGFGFLKAQGNPGEIEKAKQRLLWALIGAGILLGAVGISNVVSNTVRALIVP